MVFSCFAAYVLANNTRVVLHVYFESCMAIHDDKTIYYCNSYIIPQFGNHQIDFVPKINNEIINRNANKIITPRI